MTLTKEQKDKFFELYDYCGDITALDYLHEEICKTKEEELQELAYCVCRLNYMNDIIETESWETFQRHLKEITDLYFDMKRELCDAVGITDEDWKHYQGC